MGARSTCLTCAGSDATLTSLREGRRYVAAFFRRVAALATAVNYPDLGMRWGAGNSSIIRRVPEGTCRWGKMLVAYVIDHNTNYSPFSRP